MGQVSQTDINLLFSRLVQRYASPQEIAAELRSLINNRDPIIGPVILSHQE